jgi:hypothetical protein
LLFGSALEAEKHHFSVKQITPFQTNVILAPFDRRRTDDRLTLRESIGKTKQIDQNMIGRIALLITINRSS